MVPAALAPPVAVIGPLAGAALVDRPVNPGSNVAVVPGILTGPSMATSKGVATMADTGSRGAEARLAAVLLAVAAQAVVFAVVVLLLVLVQPGATETTLTPTPTPQSAPVAP
jgi:hypothetical protein